MKKSKLFFVENYTIDSTTEITINDNIDFTADAVAYIYNRTQDVLIHCPAKGLDGGITVSGKVITTSGLVVTDKLHIQIWDKGVGEDINLDAIIAAFKNSDGVQTDDPILLADDYEVTASFATVGNRIPMNGSRTISFYLRWTQNTSINVDAQILGAEDDSSTGLDIDGVTATKSLWTALDSTIGIILTYELKKTIKYIDFQLVSGTVGATASTFDIYYVKSLI